MSPVVSEAGGSVECALLDPLDQTHRWLAALAHHLATTPASTGSGTDIVLHQLWPMAGPRRVRTIDALLTGRLALFTFAALFSALLLAQLPLGSSSSDHLVSLAALMALPWLMAVWAASRAAVPTPQTAQLHRLRSPAHLRRLAGTLMGGLAFGLALGFVSGHAFGLAVGLAFGLYLLAGAVRRYVVFLCCFRGRLPRRLGAFLHWAYGAGLLRISGLAYQFRHRELQDWLATNPHP
ncbi:hypothetical protein ACIHCQ_16925 [Streptomyces sp. NPDC052236]|uniref:hypothetical protein n=1 Tax=Streptomyces sp. NPDC052236 TaxID=3365686 RepID=UPI0037D855B6